MDSREISEWMAFYKVEKEELDNKKEEEKKKHEAERKAKQKSGQLGG